MNNQHMKEFVENNPHLVMMKPTSREGLYVLKYRKKVFYDDLWTPELELCRGTIVDKDFNVVSIPFTKIYNYGIESKAPVLHPDTTVTAYRKVNGFMAAITWHDGDILVSTTGSIDSAYVQYVKDMMLHHASLKSWTGFLQLYPHQTFLFECVHPSDPHIIPETQGLYYLGHRNKDWGSPVIHPDIGNIGWSVCQFLGTYFEEGFKTSLGKMDWTITSLLNIHSSDGVIMPLNMVQWHAKICRHEGFVCYTEDGTAFKIKSPYYLIKKFFARSNNTSKLLHSNVKNKFDEEYYPLIDHISANIELFRSIEEQERLTYIRNFLSEMN